MRRMLRIATAVPVLVCLLLAGTYTSRVEGQAPANRVTVYEGARLITGDGSAPIEDSAFVVENNQFTRVGWRGQVQVPAGAAHVDLRGKTVMPTKVDLH